MSVTSHTPTPPVSPASMSKRDLRTAARKLLRDLTLDSVLKARYSTNRLVSRALKVFFMAYPEFGPDMMDNQIYASKLNEYVRVIEELFGGQITPAVMQSVWDQCDTCEMGLNFAVKRFRGGLFMQDNNLLKICEQPQFFIWCMNDSKVSPSKVNLDIMSDEQCNARSVLTYTFQELREARRRNHTYVLRFEAKHWTPLILQYQLKEFSITIGEIHPEGYQMWVDIGRGMLILLEIYWSVTRESHTHSKTASQFHLQTLFKMVGNRIANLDNTKRVPSFHKHRTKFNLTTVKRPTVQPTSADMFWRTSTPRNTEALRHYSESGVNVFPDGRRVFGAVQVVLPYIDVHRSITHGEDLIDNACLCNEWCNWNAFFHFNPIFRFIVVMDNQLFLRIKINVPEMYLVATTAQGSGLDPPRMQPVIQLIRWANIYRKQFQEMYLMKSSVHQIMINDHYWSRPNPDYCLGVAYNMLRHDFDVPKLCHQLSTDPMADICIRNLLDYIEVVTDLHMSFKYKDLFVLPIERNRWDDELGKGIRGTVGDFLRKSYELIIGKKYYFDIVQDTQRFRAKSQYRDTVFGSDVEYLEYVPKTEGQMDIKFNRVRALRAGPDDNALNCEVKTDRMTHCFISVYKFFTRVEPQLSTPRKLESLAMVTDYCRKMDEYFESNVRLLKYLVTDRTLQANQVSNFESNIYAIYTMKLYSFAFEIQKQCIDGRAQHLERLGHHHIQIADAYSFIWQNEAIEETYQVLCGQRLFDISIDIIDRFYYFYEDYWGVPDHQTDYKKYKHYAQYVKSAQQEYYKLFIWERHNGHEKAKFRAIIDTFEDSLDEIANRCQQIYTDCLTPPLLWMRTRYAYVIEVMDVMVLYLVRSFSSVCLSTTAQYFKEMHKLQEQELCRKTIRQFSMSKPGWIELLKTRQKFAPLMDTIRDLYIVYDDECERIAETLQTAAEMVKHFYKEMFVKLSFECWAEIELMVFKLKQSDLKLFTNVAVMQLAVGLCFCLWFADEYRSQFNRKRKRMMRILTRGSPKKLSMDSLYKCRTTALKYMGEWTAKRQDVERALKSQIWRLELYACDPSLYQMTAETIGLDMDAADEV